MKITVRAALVLMISSAVMSTTAFAYPITMDTLGPQLLAVTDGDFFDQDFQVTNGTDETWTDFHLVIAGNGDYPNGLPGIPPPSAVGTFGFIDVAGGGHDGSAYEGPGSYTVDAPAAGKNLDVLGISIAPTAILDFSIDTDDFESIGAYWVVAFATIDGDDGNHDGQVPEPTTLALLGLGLAGLGFSRRKRAS